MSTSTKQGKIKVNLSDENDHHVSVGLTIINDEEEIVNNDSNKNNHDSVHTTTNNDENDDLKNSEQVVDESSSEPLIIVDKRQEQKQVNRIASEDDEQCEPTNILTIVDDESDDDLKKPIGDKVVDDVKEDVKQTENIATTATPKVYEKPVKTPRFEELTIEEEEPIRKGGNERGNSSNQIQQQETKSNEKQTSEEDNNNDTEFSLTSVPAKILNFFEKFVTNNKGRIEMMKGLGNLMYLGSKTRTDIDVETETSNTLSLLNDIYETEKISTVISLIGWYQDYVADKHKLQNKRIQSDARFSPYHKAGQYLRLLECFILVVEIIFKQRSTYGENGKKNYWNLLIMTEVVKAIIKLLAISKSKTNTPLFLNYNILPPDEQTSNIPMASFLPVVPKYSPFDKEASSMDKFANNYKNQAKPKVGSRSGRQIPSSDQLMAMLKNGNDDVPTTSQLGEQLGLNIDSDKFMLLAPQTEELKGSLGKILMYISDTLYSLRPVVYSSLLYKYGFKSWIPFIVSLLIELASIYLTRRAIRIIKKDIKEKSPSVPAEVGSTIEEELNRRTSSLSHYLYRGPLFEIVMERIFKSILLPIFKRVPVIGASLVGYIEYIIMIQQFYFFCNPSV